MGLRSHSRTGHFSGTLKENVASSIARAISESLLSSRRGKGNPDIGTRTDDLCMVTHLPIDKTKEWIIARRLPGLICRAAGRKLRIWGK